MSGPDLLEFELVTLADGTQELVSLEDLEAAASFYDRLVRESTEGEST
jgi:hypothetical protein